MTTQMFYLLVLAALMQDLGPADALKARGQQIYELGAQSLSVSPNGRFVAFARADWGGDRGPVGLWVRDMEYGRLHHVTADTLPWIGGPRPSWSPDGRLLAYFAQSNGRLELRVWDREPARQLHRAEEPACEVDQCGWMVTPQWMSDGTEVLFVADTTSYGGERDVRSFDASRAQLDAELIGAVPAPSGITVLMSPALTAQDARTGRQMDDGGAERPAGGTGEVRVTRIVAVNVRTGTSRTVASGAGFVSLRISPDGRLAIAVVHERTRMPYFSIYAVPLERPPSNRNLQGAEVVEHGTPVDAARRPLRLIAHHVALGSPATVNFSPSGRFVAYLTAGTGDGEIVVADMENGTTRNITAEVRLPPHPFDVTFDSSGRRRLYGKFGSEYNAPLWTPDEQELLVVRPAARANKRVPFRYDLWSVSLRDRGARRVEIDSTISILALAHCAQSYVPCRIGRDGEVIARVRLQRAGSDTLAYAAVQPGSGAVRLLHVVGPAPRGRGTLRAEYEVSGLIRDFVAAERGNVLLSVEETYERPPELFMMDLARSPVPSVPLDVVNPGSDPPPRQVQLVEWVTATGDTLGARLFFPAGTREGERLPVVVIVYAGDFPSYKISRFGGGPPDWFTPILTAGRYALLTPDLPFTGAGQACDEITRNTLDALDAAVKSGRIDGDRAAVVGYSLGGYSVNCVITRTSRFHAAVTGAGLSSLTDLFLIYGGAGLVKLHAAPWEAPEQYVSDSPVYHLNRVSTPLLLIHGKLDPAARTHNALMYYGLLARNQLVALVAYDERDHGTAVRHPDFIPRIVNWLDRYLDVRE